MRIGYPCINRSIGCSPARTFRLASYTDERLRQTVDANLACLEKIFRYNTLHGLLFFRITSDLIPFASHPVCRFPWQEHFSPVFARLGNYIRSHQFRVSLHPDQFVLINSPDSGIVDRSIGELRYHVDLLELMGLDATAKIQIHVGGIYGNKAASIERFVGVYATLEERIRRHLVIENDDRLYSPADCLSIHDTTGIPVVFDVFHHSINSGGLASEDIPEQVAETWKRKDGVPMVDYSSQQPGRRRGAHAEHIDTDDFGRFLEEITPVNPDIMLEIKDKEKSALIALELAHHNPRLITGLPPG